MCPWCWLNPKAERKGVPGQRPHTRVPSLVSSVKQALVKCGGSPAGLHQSQALSPPKGPVSELSH